MCLICVDIAKGRLTSMEARSNLKEVYQTMTREHIYEVVKLVWKKEDEEYESIKDEGSD